MLNIAVIMGRLTADPELKTTSSGISVTTFTVAVDRNFAKAGEERQADFISVTAWRGTAEFVCKYFHKGSMIAVNGSIQTRTYDDKNGNKRYITEIIADNVSFTGEKRDDKPVEVKEAPAYSNGSYQDFEEMLGDDDLPF